MAEIKKGCKVRFIGCGLDDHDRRPDFYPVPGTIGTVMFRDDDEIMDFPGDGMEWLIQWPEGSTSEDDQWWCAACALEAVDE